MIFLIAHECHFFPHKLGILAPIYSLSYFRHHGGYLFPQDEIPPLKVEIVIEYVFDRERGISSKTAENYDEVCSWGEDVRVHQL